ncbi:hypothetical protein [Phenylobacterium sp.]|uniref:hypothetical protein n=1 Tax=Phenylobacterium sp. TaxID=1871053 RepID=UPI002FE024E1
MTTQKSEIRAVEYRARAEASAQAAQGCALDRTREQHERAAAVWADLAEAEERRARNGRVFLGAATS